MPDLNLAYITDVEGHWRKLEAFTRGNPLVRLDGAGQLHVSPGGIFVFGGDAIDRGPEGRRVVAALLDVKRRQPGQVVLLAGNRDINKLRLPRELGGKPPAKASPEIAALPKPQLLKWILQNTMGAGLAFEMRRQELGPTASDDDVTQSFLEDLQPHGVLPEYLSHCQLAFRSGATLFVHGALTSQSLGHVPDGTEHEDVDRWAQALNGWFAQQMDAFRKGRVDALGEPGWSGAVAYQAPVPGTRANPGSVVYGRFTDDVGNPHLPAPPVVAALARSGVQRLVVGHTPSGDVPAVLRDGNGFELVMADTSYGRLEDGACVRLGDHGLAVSCDVELDDGSRDRVDYVLKKDDVDAPTGKRDAVSGHLVKGPLQQGGWLLYKSLPGYVVEHARAANDDVAARSWSIPT